MWMRNKTMTTTMNCVVALFDTKLHRNPYDYYGHLKYSKHGEGFSYHAIPNAKEYLNFWEQLIAKASKNEIGVGIILEFHGSQRGLHIGDDIIIWKQITNLVSKLNLACRNQVYVIFATCYASKVGKEQVNPAIVFGNETIRAPSCYTIFPREEVKVEEVNKLLMPFVERWLSQETDTLDDVFIKLFQHGDGRYFLWTSCFSLWDDLRSYYTTFISRKMLGDSAILNQHLRSQKKSLKKRLGKQPSPTNYRDLKKEVLSIDFHKYLAKRFFDQFFMIDLYPENALKYQPVMDFSDIEELIEIHSS